MPVAALAHAEALVAAREATGTAYNEAAEAVRADPRVGLLDDRAARVAENENSVLPHTLRTVS